jgi:regulator of replication initiation timing
VTPPGTTGTPATDPAAGTGIDADPTARELRAMVDALREALEAQAAGRSDEIQAAVQAAAEENAALRELADTLRARLEEQARAHDDARAAAERAFADERAQLAATITTLRARLEESG